MDTLTLKKGQISVIMGVYNCADTLPEAIDSIIAQTYSNWELIICDDCSTDGRTYELAQKYAVMYPGKIKIIQNKKNSKLAYSLNHCLEYATGEYVARMDGDDLSVPERFEKQIFFLKSHPEFQLVGSAMQRFSAEKGLADIVYNPEYPDRFTLRRYMPFSHATIMTYRSVYDALGGYTVAERTKRAQDYDLWFKFYEKGFNGYNFQEALYLVREDEAAVRRRTFKVRWNALKTTYIGYKLLKYPKWWLIHPTLTVFWKSAVPYWVIDIYRSWKSKHN